MPNTVTDVPWARLTDSEAGEADSRRGRRGDSEALPPAKTHGPGPGYDRDGPAAAAGGFAAAALRLGVCGRPLPSW